MSRLAKKLCDEIVEPSLKQSRESTTKRTSSKYHNSSFSDEDSKATRSIIVEKKKVISKLDPNDSTASRTKFRSKETLLKKKYIDISVNTLVTGPLRCDNDCVTMVRKRDNKCSCKCAQKRMNYKANAKQIQTFDSKNFFLTDKACAQCIETASCGTQFLEQLRNSPAPPSTVSCTKNYILRPQSSAGPKRSSKDIIVMHPSIKCSSRIKQEPSSTSSKPAFLNFMGARRWALSQYPPTRGPDF